MRTLRKSRFLGILALFVIVLSLVAGAASATAQVTAPPVVVLADVNAIRQSEDGASIARAFITLVTALHDQQPFMLVPLDQPDKVYGPLLAQDPGFQALMAEVNGLMEASESRGQTDLFAALASTSELLAGERSVQVYLLTGGSWPADLAQLGPRLTPLVNIFKQNSWAIHGVGLPGTSESVQGLLRWVSSGTGGKVFNLTLPDGFKGLTDAMLRDSAKGALSQVGNGMLEPNQLPTYSVSIAPGTRETTLLFFKDSPSGYLRLTNPSGFEASAGDRSVSTVMETPFLVVWRLVDPAPGVWKVEAHDFQGLLSAWQYSVNKYYPVLEPLPTVPLDQPATLVASIRDGQGVAVLDRVQVLARVTTPQGATLVYEMNDQGKSGDAVAGDGYFSVTVPPLELEGDYKVNLELAWPEYNYRMSSESGFSVQPFPSIELSPLKVEELKPGEKVKVATATVHVQGEPYAIPTGQLSAAIASDVERAGTIEVVPQRLLDQDRAWQFDVYFTPQEEGLHTLVLTLGLLYAGRQYVHTSDSLVLSSLLPAPPPAPSEPSVQVTVPAPTIPAPEPRGFPWGLLAIPALALAALVYWLTRPSPRGYLVSDRNELVVDFRNLRRHPVMSLLSKNTVRGNELNLPGFEEVSFQFMGKRIALRTRRTTPTVRVNNQPLVDEITLADRAWIGAHGKLYSFLLKPPQEPQTAFGGDDGN